MQGAGQTFHFVTLSKNSLLMYLQGWPDHNFDTSIGIKRMGELDVQLFQRALKENFPRSKVDEKAVELCSLWQDYIRNPEWHPFKIVKIPGSEERKVRISIVKQELLFSKKKKKTLTS